MSLSLPQGAWSRQQLLFQGLANASLQSLQDEQRALAQEVRPQPAGLDPSPWIWEALAQSRHNPYPSLSPLAAGAGEGPGVSVPGPAGKGSQQAAELPGGAGCHEAASR